MQEFELPLEKLTRSGLRPERFQYHNTVWLTECCGLVPREEGLVEPEGLLNPTGASLNWPFPQLFDATGGRLLAAEQKLYSVSNLWTLDELDIYDAYAESRGASIPAGGGLWHLADFFQTWFLFKENCVVFKSNLKGMFGEENKVLLQDSITVSTGCAFRGRLITAGFNPSDFWSVDWDSMMEHWTQELPYAVNPSLTMNSNFVMWSSIGGGDTLNLFFPDLAVSGVLKEDGRTTVNDAMLMDLYRRNEAGFMPMPWNGTVYAVKELGEGVAVYGDAGIAFLAQVSQPVPTFGVKHILPFGIAGRGAVTGSNAVHTFLTAAGELWQLDANLGTKRLGYSEYLGSLSEPVLNFDSGRGEAYVGDAAKTYCLTSKGLAQVPTVVSTLFNDGSGLVSVSQDTDEETVVVSDIFDFGISDFKTITTVEVGHNSSEDVFVAVDYRADRQSDFTRSSWVLLNPEGFARVQVSAVEFRFCFKFESSSGLAFDYAKARWQSNGKRTIRGLHAPTANA